MNESLKNIKTRVRNHIHNNRNTYIAGMIGVVIGGAVTYIAIKIDGDSSVSLKAPLNSTINIDGDNNVVNFFNTIMQNLGNADCPSRPVFDLTTKRAFRSIREAADLLDVSRSGIAKNLAGDISDVKGHRFIEFLTETSSQ